MNTPHQLTIRLVKNRLCTSVLVLICLIYIDANAQSHYNAGLRTLRLYDSTRVYKPNTTPSDKLHYRPIDVDVWYPAVFNESDTVVSFQDLVELLESRAEFYNDIKDYDGITDELLQYICAASDCSDYKSLKKIKTDSRLDASQALGSFPLVLYFSSMNGMSYENYLLFEKLARKGFVVASISSIGRYPGEMTMQLKDLEEQIADAKFVKEYLVSHHISSEKTGLLGYSWGGLAATLLAMEDSSEFGAVLSLDGSEAFQYYGGSEDQHLEQIRNSKAFKPQNIKAPYLYLSSDKDSMETEADSVYNIHKYLTGVNTYLQVTNAAHEDFSCLYAVANNERKIVHEKIQDLVIGYLSEKLHDDYRFNTSIASSEASSPFPTSKPNLKKSEIWIHGTVRDNKTNFPLPYVNVGVLNKNKGTATDVNGQFRLLLPVDHLKDTLKISMVGYEPTKMLLNDLSTTTSQSLNIRLREKSNELQEVVVTEKAQVLRTLGNKSLSKFFGGKFASNDFGSEMAIKIKIGKRPVYLNKFAFNISYNEGDSAAFRFNVYNVKNGLPYENILNDNIIVRVGNRTGQFEIDLVPYNILIHDDFIVSLEFIEGSKNSGIVFSAGFVNKGTYHRTASHARWKKYPMGVGFNVTVGY